MKRNDIILIVAILVISIALLLGVNIYRKNNTSGSAAAQVTIDGKVYGTYPLNQDTEERIELTDGSYNILVISDGKASVTEASCPDKVCVNTADIHYTDETIVCLPNKVVVKIVNGEENDVDGMTR